ncbi:MAG: ASKHA domain-containing protein [Thermodesulfobacteriaceae bacterium]|nr:ASKHA domain-containing protein [Thermodesulfobacteriaceae bacterium]MCX8041894.1 ASKHA domain-containing protein [Thermodesulfobacteriaceae bacterium]MDW8135376.1 ASKHA domain-containing protein [Thermodesulfobacterium sp.]
MGSSVCGRCMKESAVRILELEVEKPVLGKANFDSERLLKALKKVLGESFLKISLYVLRKLPQVLREGGHKVWVILVKEEEGWIVSEIFSKKPERVLGVAIDLGSTSIAFYLYNFLEKKIIKEYSILNPQIPMGEDILTRLHLAKKEENLNYIREITLESINRELREIDGASIFYVSLCGNTAMSHFVLGLPVNYLFVEPYVPCANWYGIFKKEEVGFEIHPEGRIFVFPSAGTYFGGDLVAGLYFSEIYKRERMSFFIDVGTNAEVVLGNKDFLLACAGAAGPALEGGIFDCGCQAKDGAIESIKIYPQVKKIEYQTIGTQKPVGICGSGVIELMAELFIKGILTPEGKFNLQSFPERFTEINEEKAFIVVPPEESATGKPIYIKASEVRSFIRSKGAMYTILSLLCEKLGISFDEVEGFYIAGSFGNHIKVEAAVDIGMLPEEALNKAYPLGNAAGKGALKFLKEANLKEIKKIMETITYLELNVEPRFMQLLTGALFFPHVNRNLFPTVMKKLKNF